jgi:hypothetical protein
MSSETNQTILDNSNTSVNTEHLQLSKMFDDEKMTQILNESLSFLEKTYQFLIN